MYKVFFNYLAILLSLLIEGQAIMGGTSHLPAFSIGKQYAEHV